MRYNIVIVGGGIAGLEAARRLLRLGYCPIIVERQDRLGGHVATWHCLFPDMSPAQETVSRLIEESSSANIFLGTEDVSIAKTIAKAMRGPSGGFSSIKAVGIKFPEHSGVVVSMNMFDCINTPIPRLFEFCKREAARFGVAVTGSELVGPIKLESVIAAFSYSLCLENFRDEQILETHLMDL